MKQFLEMYRAQFVIKTTEQLQYRVAMTIWMIETVLTPMISIVVWSTVSEENGRAVGGYNAGTFASYFILAMIVNYICQTWVFLEFEYRVRNGILSPLLLRPVHPIHADIAVNISYKCLMAVVLAPATVVFFFLFHPVFHLNVWILLGFLLSLLLAAILRFALEWTLALLAFWTTRVSVFNQLYTVTRLFLTGQLVPLALFPPAVQTVASFLPFRWMLSFPIELCLGQLSGRDILLGLGMQCLWIAIGVWLVLLVWRTGIRRFSAVGA